MSLTFDGPSHTYHLDGERVPSVTTILTSAGLCDFSALPTFIRERALARGTAVHAAVHYYNERDLDVDRFNADFPDYAGYLQGWITFCTERRFTAVLNERRIASRRHRVAGTFDCLGILDDIPVLLDFATGRPQDVAKDLQTAAYYGIAREWADLGEDPELSAFLGRHPLVRRYAVALRRDGTYHLEGYADPTHWRQFLTLVDAYRIVTPRRNSPIEEAA